MSRYEWAREQLAEAGVDLELQTDVVRLLSVWEQMTFAADDPRADRVLSIFSDLARGVAIEKDADPGFIWVSALQAKPRQKDRVRIKRDAFTSPVEQQLNGKEGIVARIARGTLVMAVDNEGSLHVSPEKLETRVPVPPA